MTQRTDFDRQVSDALHSIGDALPVSNDVLRRLIAHGRSGDTVVVPLHRRRWVMPLLAAAVVLAVATAAALITGGSGKPAPPVNVRSSSPATPSGTPTTASPTTASPTTTPTRTGPSTVHDPGADQPWSARVITISVAGLGAVKRGMTLPAAQAAAGYSFDGSGDGYRYSLARDARFGDHLYVGPGLYNGAGPQGPTQCVGATGGTGRQTIRTPEGVKLGDPVSRLLAVYGTAAVRIPKPSSGLFARDGYAVTEHGGDPRLRHRSQHAQNHRSRGRADRTDPKPMHRLAQSTQAQPLNKARDDQERTPMHTALHRRALSHAAPRGAIEASALAMLAAVTLTSCASTAARTSLTSHSAAGTTSVATSLPSSSPSSPPTTASAPPTTASASPTTASAPPPSSSTLAPPPLEGAWDQATLTISSRGLGAVQFGSDLASAQRATGVTLTTVSVANRCTSGHYHAPEGGADLWLQADPTSVDVLFAVAQTGPPSQKITTTEGITLGHSTYADVKHAYPDLKPGSGYEGNQPTHNFTATDRYGGTLYFDFGPSLTDGTTVYSIAVHAQPPHHECGGA